MVDETQGKAFDENVKDTAPLAPTPKAAAAKPEADPYPNKRHYGGGFIFNFPISHYEARTEAKIRQDILDGGNSPEQTDKDMAIIREGLAFHNADFAKEEKGGNV